jgi:hypothetical protein
MYVIQTVPYTYILLNVRVDTYAEKWLTYSKGRDNNSITNSKKHRPS